MESRNALPSGFRQNEHLPIRLVAPGFGHASSDDAASYGLPHRLAYYFFWFVWEGTAEFEVDLEKLAVEKYEVVFALPHQIRQLLARLHGNTYFKLGRRKSAFPGCPVIPLPARPTAPAEDPVHRPGRDEAPDCF